jgi:N-acetylglucosaminyl-diphospho-decaprenol L-rhamnosyltransferase
LSTCNAQLSATRATTAHREVSIVVVSFDTRELTLECLRSIHRETTNLEFEVIVFDNASSDGSADAIAAEFPQVRLIRSSRNVGFAAANNLAAAEARGEYLLLLNPDTVVLDNTVNKLLAFASENPDGGIFGGRTLNADRSLNPKSCWGRPTPWSTFCRGIGLSYLFAGNRLLDPEALGGWKRDTVRQVDIVSGCLLMIRMDLWRNLGGFDEQFFMYGEDADLCLRAKKRGARCVICPQATIVHYGGASERVREDKFVRVFSAKARLFTKHWRPFSAMIGIAFLNLYPLTRLILLWTLRRFGLSKAESYQTWLAIWRRRADWSGLQICSP